VRHPARSSVAFNDGSAPVSRARLVCHCELDESENNRLQAHSCTYRDSESGDTKRWKPLSKPDRQGRVRLECAVHKAGSAALVLFLFLASALVWPQTALPPNQAGADPEQATQQLGSAGNSSLLDSVSESNPQAALTTPVTSPVSAAQETENSGGKQTKRMFWVVPNFTAVSADTQLPPLSVRDKFTLARQDSVDYSSFVWAGLQAAQSMALRSDPALGHGLAGYTRYYWRAFADQASGSFFTEAIVPALTHEDPRYYTLGHGSFFRRTKYALSQVVLTRTDSGGVSFNYSEIVGNGMEAGLANLYYPAEDRGFRKTAENWATQLEASALNNVIREFWPDIRHKVLRQK
jgi:hypothetical protein